MTRYYLITAGIVSILLMVVLWSYLFLFGAPEKPLEVFSNLGIADEEVDSTRTVNAPPVLPKDTTRLALLESGLEQITTRAVAGSIFIERGETLLYAEKGTGHIYEIDIASGLERQVSRTTIPGVTEVIFSPTGTRVVFVQHADTTQQAQVGSLLGKGEVERLIALKENTDNVEFVSDDRLRFTLKEDTATVLYERDLDELSEKTIARIPFTDASVHTTKLGIVFSPKPGSAPLTGALYLQANTTIVPLTDTFEGFSGFIHEETPLFSHVTKETTVGAAVVGSTLVPQGVTFLKEKCAGRGTALWCAAPLTADSTYITDWYKGVQVSTDYLWKVDTQSGSAELVADLQELSGKIFDVRELKTGEDATKLLLTHKLDDTLWLYTEN